MTGEIRQATTAADFDAMAALVADYVAWCRDRYQDHPWFVDRVFGHQALEAELEVLATSYSPPLGIALIALDDGQVDGTVAYRDLGDGVCEMKRLFVSSRSKRHGTGRRLCQALIESARGAGYRLMRLDTGHLMAEAITMYGTLGFERCPVYCDYPADLMPFLVFMELQLAV